MGDSLEMSKNWVEFSFALTFEDMSPDALVQLAEEIAIKAHAGQFRRGGVIPYIEHPKAVAKRVLGDPEAQVVAWLHDVIEDTEETEENLRASGIPSHLVDAIVSMTKTSETTYEEYLDRIAASPLVTKVKIADMISNLADNPSTKQIRKYAKGLLRLTLERKANQTMQATAATPGS